MYTARIDVLTIALGNMSDDQAPRRSRSINVVRYGVSSPTTTQK
jgi:hypothetical protein